MSYQQLPPAIRTAAEQAKLTPRQTQVLQDTLNGHSTKRIARSMGLAESTIRAHLERALKKLEPHYRKDAA